MVRFAALILCIVLVMQSCIPCADTDHSVRTTNTQEKKSPSPTEQDSDHSDVCSPFCQCSCCSCVGEPQTIVFLVYDCVVHMLHDFGDQYIPELVGVFSPVWQPPRA